MTPTMVTSDSFEDGPKRPPSGRLHPARHSMKRVVGLLVLAAGLISPAISGVSDPLSTWYPIGPAPIKDFFPGGVSGRATAIAVHPTDFRQAYVGTASGGLWYTQDRGLTWSALTDDTEALAVGSISLSGCGGSICSGVAVGTGENSIRRDTYHGAGLLVGVLASATPVTYNWFQKDGFPGADFFRGSINDVIRAPTSGDLYVTYSSGVSTNSSQATRTAPIGQIPGYGIFHSDDNGNSWQKLTVLGAEGARPTDLEIDPDDEQILYAGFLGRGVFKSENGGVDWCPLNDGITVEGCDPASVPLPDPAQVIFDHVELALAPSDPSRMYVTLGHCPDRLIQRCLPSLYKSVTAGDSWNLQMAGSSSEGGDGWQQLPYGYSRYTHALTADPTDDTRLWMGGIRLFLSNNSGVNWSPLDYNAAYGSSKWGQIVHMDHHDVVINPQDRSQMYNANDGGVYYSQTSGTSWTPRNDGLQITGFQSIAASPLTSVVIGGTQDNSAAMWTGTDAWESLPCCGDSGFTVIDAVNPDVMYAGTNFGVVTRSIDGGKTWCDVMSGVTSGPEAFYAPIVQDPTPPHPLYYGSARLYRGQATGPGCEDFAWTPVSPFIPQSTNDEIVGSSNVITAITVAPGNPNRIYFGMYEGGIYYTDAACTGSGCWTPTFTPNLFPITRIAVDPGNHDNVWATLAAWETENVWKTTDPSNPLWFGVDGLPETGPANTIQFEPGTAGTLWVGFDGNHTGKTVFRSLDSGATWLSESDGMPNVPVYEFAFVPDKSRVYAATHGRGAFLLGTNLVIPKGTWVNGLLWDEWLWGWVLPPNEECIVEVLQQDGTACASGSEDAMGGTIVTDGGGVLRTSRENMWSDRPGVFACFGGTCAGNTPVENCNDAANPPAQVVVQCGAETATVDIKGVMLNSNPASSQFGVGLATADGSGGGAAGGGRGNFDLTAAVQAGDGTTRSLCTVPVAVMAGESVGDILTRAMNEVNGNATCSEATVSAALMTGGDMSSEDDFERDPTLTLTAPGVTGTQLFTAVHLAPGELTGTCIEVQSLGLPVHDQALVPTIRFKTPEQGSAGGDVTVVEETPLGTCSVTVNTLPGETAAEIVTSLVNAFQAAGIPGPNPGCPSKNNPRDAVAKGDDLMFVMPTEVEICVGDSGVGFAVGLEDLTNSNPGALATSASPAECTSAAGAQLLLDGSGSTDPDSSAGTNDDIVSFEWYEGYGTAAETLLGTGELLMAQLSLGIHQVTLKVTDNGGLFSVDTIPVSVVDTTPPTMTGTVSPNSLWPPNHGMVPVTTSLSATDLCTLDSEILLILNTTASDEPDDAPGPSDGATVNDIRNAQLGSPDFDVKLRAERDNNGSGRTYTLTYKASDQSFNSTSTPLTVFVPMSVGGVTEPIIIVTEATPVGTELTWSENPHAAYYNIIKGRLSNLTDDGESYDMGETECVEAGSADASTTGNEDATVPPPGEGWFYIIESANGYRTGYGTLTALRERLLGQAPDPCAPAGQ